MITIVKEEDILTEYLKKRDLKLTGQRKVILDTFLSTEEHVTAEELYDKLKKANPGIGLTTVYRTLKLFCDCGLAKELQFGDGIARYEHLFGHEHHDHLVCVKCGKFTEVMDSEIEKLQQKLARKNNFTLLSHRMELYGVCEECSKKP
jgi:Fur family transcriptional regulator, ferric uptake regulator